MRLSAGYYDAYYRKAQQVRTLLTRDFLAAFAEVDVLVTPVTPTPAFKLGEKTDDPVKMYLEDIYLGGGEPGGSLWDVGAVRKHEGWDCRLECRSWAKHFDEATMLRVAQAVETRQQTMSGSDKRRSRSARLQRGTRASIRAISLLRLGCVRVCWRQVIRSFRQPDLRGLGLESDVVLDCVC